MVSKPQGSFHFCPSILGLGACVVKPGLCVSAGDLIQPSWLLCKNFPNKAILPVLNHSLVRVFVSVFCTAEREYSRLIVNSRRSLFSYGGWEVQGLRWFGCLLRVHTASEMAPWCCIQRWGMYMHVLQRWELKKGNKLLAESSLTWHQCVQKAKAFGVLTPHKRSKLITLVCQGFNVQHITFVDPFRP